MNSFVLKAESDEPKEVELPPHSPRYCQITCECGKRCGAYLEHYQLVRCGRCDRIYVALQPKRNGPLMLFRWAGDFQSIA